MKWENKYIELGRSMIEIIGMLAIIGVISIGSVVGLRYAFEKQESNEIINELSQQAVLISSLKEHSQVADLEDLKNSEFSKRYNVSYNYNEQDGFFSITLNNVPDEVVQQLISLKWNLPYNVYINGVQIYDYNVQSKKEKHADLLSYIFIKPAVANDGLNTIKFVFQNQLDESVKPDYIDKDTCLATGGKWEETRCFCPNGAIMAASGCITRCGGDTGIECPTEAICFRDSECRGCSEICQNGLCVLDEKDVCNGKPYCDGDKITSCFRTGSKSTACAVHYGKETDCSEKGEGIICSVNNGIAGCVQGPLDCGEHGQWNTESLTCLCDEGFSGIHCEKQEGYSPCQTYSVQNGQEVWEFKPEGTPCDHAGIEGKCNRYGRCVPTTGNKCKSIDGCPEGYFCNYGGHVGDYQGGGTPDICEVVSADTFKYNGKLYYYNTATDLKAWCRPADKGKNCTWGFLSYYGAQSWCKSLGAELVDASVIRNNCNAFSILPSVMGNQQYWAKGQNVVHMGQQCSIQKMSRSDGYAAAAGVLCVTEIDEQENGLTDEEKDFIEEMRQVKAILNRLDNLKNKRKQLEPEKKRYEAKLQELYRALSNSDKITTISEDKGYERGVREANKPQTSLDSSQIQEQIEQFQQKYTFLLYMEEKYEKMIPVLNRVYEIATQTLQAAVNLTDKNIEQIRQYKNDYDMGNYPQKVLDILGLGHLLSAKPLQKTSFDIKMHIFDELFGIKTANASLGGGAAGMCSGIAIYDTAVGFVGSGLDAGLGLFGVSTDMCSTVTSYMKVGANVDRLIDGCGLEDVNHIDETLLNGLFSGVLAMCQGGCTDDEVFIFGYGCCPKGHEEECKCYADKGTYINGICCKQSGAFWADPVEKCTCEANGMVWFDE